VTTREVETFYLRRPIYSGKVFIHLIGGIIFVPIVVIVISVDIGIYLTDTHSQFLLLLFIFSVFGIPVKYIFQRFNYLEKPNLVISDEGIWYSQIEPATIPWSAIREIDRKSLSFIRLFTEIDEEIKFRLPKLLYLVFPDLMKLLLGPGTPIFVHPYMMINRNELYGLLTSYLRKSLMHSPHTQAKSPQEKL
jgi:hypothetical protein